MSCTQFRERIITEVIMLKVFHLLNLSSTPLVNVFYTLIFKLLSTRTVRERCGHPIVGMPVLLCIYGIRVKIRTWFSSKNIRPINIGEHSFYTKEPVVKIIYYKQ